MNSGAVPVSEGIKMKVRAAKKAVKNGAAILVEGEKVFAANVIGKTVYFAGRTASILEVSVCTEYVADSVNGDRYKFAAVN
jgi:hypothetical protein